MSAETGKIDRLSVFVIGTALLFSSLILFADPGPARVIIPAASVIMVFMMAKPEFFFALFIIFRSSMDLVSAQQVGKAVNVSSIATVFLVAMGGVILLRRENIAKIRSDRTVANANTAFLSFLAISGLCLINSSDILNSVADWTRLVSVIVIFDYAFIYFSGEKRFRKFFFLILASAAAPLCVGIYQYLFKTGDVSETPGFNRLYGTFGHPNAFSQYLVILFLAALYYLRAYKPAKMVRLALWAILALTLFELLHTYTRGSWVALPMALAVFSVSQNKRQNLAFFGLAVVVALALYPSIQHRFMDLQSHSVNVESSWEWRLHTWLGTAGELRNHIFIGQGLGMYEQKFRAMAHNDYLRLAYETGIAGAAAYILFLYHIAAAAIRKLRRGGDAGVKARYAAAASIICAFTLMSSVDNLSRAIVVPLYTFCMMGALMGSSPGGER